MARKGLLVVVLGLSLASAGSASAALIPIGPGAFGPGASLIDFGPVQTLLPVNGMTIDGVQFGFTIGGSPSNDAVIDDGPGNTNNITIANVEGNTAGVLSMVFPSAQIRMGYGFAISTTVPRVLNATTVELFAPGNLSLGTLSVNAVPDPGWVGGFLGVQSSIPFVRAEVIFDSVAATRFAFDNLVFETPEPASLTLLGAGLLVLLGFARRRRT